MGLPLIYLIAGATWILSWVVKRWLQHTYSKWSAVENLKGVTGAETAAAILASNGVTSVRIEPVQGRLTDHYDPVSDVLRLSASNYAERSVAAMAVSAHEAGHAMQDATDDARMKLRRILVPVAAAGSRIGPMVLFMGLIWGSPALAQFGAVLLLGTVLFQLATLPVEFNASRRALDQLRRLGLIDDASDDGPRAVLTAAAFTYVAAAATSLAYFATLFAGRRASSG